MSVVKQTLATFAVLALLPIGQSFAEVGDLRVSGSYAYTDTDYADRPAFLDAADIEINAGRVGATYVYSDKLTLGLNVGLSESDTDRPAGPFSFESDVRTIGAAAFVSLSDPWTVFAGVTHIDIETDGDDGLGTKFNVDSDGWAYQAGFSYDRQLDGNAFFILTGSVNYADIDTESFTAFFNVGQSSQSVTVLNLTPEVGTVIGDLTASVGVSYISKNSDFRQVNDPTRFEAGLNLSYALENAWEIRGRVAQNFAERETDTTRVTIGVARTINLLK